jgi:tetratricopeptide (TPR) repeat protein
MIDPVHHAGRVRGVALLAALLTAAAPLASARKAPPSAPVTIGDLDRDSVQVQPSTVPGGSASRAMDNYRAFLELQNADPKLRAEALRRLGDLNLDSGELERMASEISQIDAAGAEAIRLYTTLLKAYPDYPRNDQVLYQLARAYETTGQPEQALTTLDSIVGRYPRSRDIAEVQFRRGELLFSARRYAEAQQAYEAVLERGRDGSAFYAQSLYKHGWSLFKRGLNEDSLGSFADLLDLRLVDPANPARARDWDSLGRADRELAQDTLRVMSITFSYLDGAKSIDAFTSRRASVPYAWLLYSQLGDLYVEKQRYQDAAATYRAFVGRDPVDAHAPALATAAIEAYRKGGFAQLMLEAKIEYVQRYGFDQPFWVGREHGEFPKVVDELKTNLRDVAQYYHSVAQQSKSLQDYGAAAHWYRAYLQYFPEDPESAATNYLLADALFESHQYLEAAGEYERTAYDYPNNARSAEAGYAALVSYQDYEQTQAPEARAATHLRAIDSALKFAERFPQHPESAGVLTRAAQDLYAAGDPTRAVQSAQALLARAPPVDASMRRIGWTLIGQVAFNQNDFPQAEAAFVQALAAAGAADPERADITERLADAVYKQADAKRSGGDQSGAAEDFLRVARVAPGSKVVETSQYDAATALVNAQQWDRAIEVLEAYRRSYPQGQYRAQVGPKLAVAYAAAGRGVQAAAEFERIAANPQEDRAVVHEALTRAADLYAQSDSPARSVPLLERLVREYPTPVPEAIEIRARLADLAAHNGDAERVRYWQHEIVLADGGAGAARTERTRYLAARAQLALVEPVRDAFRNVKLVAPLKQTLVAKKKALEAAVAAYKGVAGYEVAETTTAATYETAELYHTLAHDLLASERPKKLSSEELEQYDSLLEEQAYPFEEQSIAIHELNTQRAAEGVYDVSVKHSFEALAALKPARYGKSERGEPWVAVLAAADPAQPPTGAAIDDFARATQLAQEGRSTDAALELKQFELQHPGFAAPAVDLGLLARAQGNLPESEASLQRATTLGGAGAVAWDELGLTLRQEGKFADARTAYAHAIAQDDSYALAHRNLAVLLDLYLGDPVAALPEMVRYQQLSAEDKPVTTWIAELRARTGIKAVAPPDVPTPATAAAGTNGGPP